VLTSLKKMLERERKRKKERNLSTQKHSSVSFLQSLLFLNFSFLFIFFYETSTIYSKRTRVVWYDYILDDSTLLTLLLMSQSTRISSRV
jgi:hypothetical protein